MPSPSGYSRKKRSYRFGIIAEYVAAAYLMAKGYRILKLRYRNPKGEIDILASKGDILAIVEVKARKCLSDCTDAVTPHKQRQLLGAVQWLMADPSKIAGLRRGVTPNIRFDVVWVIPRAFPKHIKDAWRL